jgi:hypothetical protein
VSGTGNATVSVVAEANTGGVERTAVVTLTGGGGTQTVTVSQASGVAGSLSVAPDSLGFEATGGTQSLTVTAEGSWAAIGSATWLTVSPASGTGNATVSVAAAANTGAVARTATVTLTCGGVLQTVDITQGAATPPAGAALSASPDSLGFEVAGGTLNVAVLSDRSWTAVASAAWLTLSPASGTGNGTIAVAAAANADSVRTAVITLMGSDTVCTVVVTQEAGQKIVVDTPPPTEAGGEGSVGVSLNVPVDRPFAVQFALTLPAGFQPDQSATALVPALAGNYLLTVSAIATNSWQFIIQPGVSARAGVATSYRELVKIVYSVASSTPAGEYELKLSNVNLFLSDGTSVHQDEISVPVTISSALGAETAEASGVWYVGGVLYVHTSTAEPVTVYSIAGQPLYRGRKAAGQASFRLNNLPRGVLIVRGGSGWAKKLIIH